MNMMTLPQTNGAAAGMTSLWLSSSVQEFFSAVNWDDRPIELHPPQGEEVVEESNSLSLSLSVSRFFDLIPWEGDRPIAAPTPVGEPVSDQPAFDDITLEDFSDLF